MEITARPEVISLAGGLPDTSTFPPEAFAAEMHRIEKTAVAEVLQYGPTEGSWLVREQIVEVMAAEGTRVDAIDITVTTGAAPDANEIPVPKDASDSAMDAAACIGCGACVAACPNSAANLFTAAKMQHLNLLPQGQAERWSRSEAMVEKMEEFFGSCTNHGECQEACPKEISIDFIAMMNRDYAKAKLVNRRRLGERKVG